MSKKILIIGANGQLAYDLLKVFNLKSYHLIKATRQDFDIEAYEKAEKFIIKHKPDIIINTAAFHKTEECELNPLKSFQINSIGAYNISKIAAQLNAVVIYISTDYVFDGSKKGFKEDDKVNPLNVYGESKLAGENLTKIANGKHYIIRTSWLFGHGKSSKGYNFVDLMLDKAKNDEQISVVNDQVGSPTHTLDLAKEIKLLLKKKAPYGIYHITNSGYCSWYQFAKEIFKAAHIKANLKPISSSSTSKVKRPRYSILLNQMIKKMGFKIMPKWQDSLIAYLKTE